MNLQNKHILFAAQYAAPYAGNFIASLIALEKSLVKNYNVRCAYLFPQKALQQSWIEDFKASRQVYFSSDNNVLIQDYEADEIIQQIKPDLIYTHFDGYDVPMHKAVKRSGRYIRQVWHMHDALRFHHNPLKAAYQVLCFAKHYGLTTFGLKLGGGKPLCYSCLQE